MKSLRVAVAVLFLAGCGDSEPAGPSAGAISFRLDANSCGPIFGTQTLSFTFFIDGTQVGTASLGVNVSSPAYPASVGSHVASARITNTQYQWQNITLTVAAGQTSNYILTC
jgi:hypothetical protein